MVQVVMSAVVYHIAHHGQPANDVPKNLKVRAAQHPFAFPSLITSHIIF
jgi:hypothetical protein